MAKNHEIARKLEISAEIVKVKSGVRRGGGCTEKLNFLWEQIPDTRYFLPCGDHLADGAIKPPECGITIASGTLELEGGVPDTSGPIFSLHGQNSRTTEPCFGAQVISRHNQCEFLLPKHSVVQKRCC